MQASALAAPPSTILVVDDTATNLQVLVRTLQTSGHRILAAKDGPTALDIARRARPDLMLLDIMMPGMDGYEICDRLKANPFTKDIPVMFVTAMDQERQEAKGLAMGAVDYLAKPVSPPIVLARVRNQLELKKQRDFLRRLSSVDGLTGVANRRSFEEDFDKEWRRAARHQAPLTLLLADIDHLRAYNDAYGYLAGDDCLKMVAQALAKSMMRPGDVIARYGGEEFVGLMPDTDAKGSNVVTDRLLTAVRSLALPHAHSDAAPIVTISIGVASCFPHRDNDRAGLFKLAGDALYAAKTAGRNQAKIIEFKPEKVNA